MAALMARLTPSAVMRPLIPPRGLIRRKSGIPNTGTVDVVIYALDKAGKVVERLTAPTFETKGTMASFRQGSRRTR